MNKYSSLKCLLVINYKAQHLATPFPLISAQMSIEKLKLKAAAGVYLREEWAVPPPKVACSASSISLWYSLRLDTPVSSKSCFIFFINSFLLILKKYFASRYCHSSFRSLSALRFFAIERQKINCLRSKRIRGGHLLCLYSSFSHRKSWLSYGICFSV